MPVHSGLLPAVRMLVHSSLLPTCGNTTVFSQTSTVLSENSAHLQCLYALESLQHYHALQLYSRMLSLNSTEHELMNCCPTVTTYLQRLYALEPLQHHGALKHQDHEQVEAAVAPVIVQQPQALLKKNTEPERSMD
eukprot:TRINITY_DN14935_c0_g1_i1.p1 TRINITY_DN14935_c0_g1~~TRINITY_DN14935_c0_g1_i1.p1  ORF type:complete len:136 (+),score=17.99 TRINITY_DN14935_c0_g1_i1:155-562(+)